MLRTIRAFWHDQRGIALILVSIMLPAIIGFSLLTIDMSRANNLHNDLQKGADAFALAGAAELDGNPDAIIRSDRAIANLIDNTYKFSNVGPIQTLTNAGITRRYLRSLPPNDTDAIRVEDVITDEVGGAGEAEFVEVTVNPTGFSAIFPASFLTGSTADNSFNVRATSVAGFAGVVVCDMTPLFICNPFEGSGIPLHQVVSDQNFYRKGIKLVQGGGAGAWGPGNFGFLNPTGVPGYGAGDLADDIAQADTPECINSRGVNMRTGGPQPAVRDAINVRFDIYGGQMHSNDPLIPPAPNVRKGYKYKNSKNPNACNMDPVTSSDAEWPNYRHMTQDTAYDSTYDRIGNGMWDYEGYMAANGFTTADMADFVDSEGNAYSNANPPSRYDLYKYELSTRGTGNDLVASPSLGGETGAAACHANPSTDPDRRLIYGAIINCIEHEEDLNGASGDPIPAVGFASFFLTEPVDNVRTNGDILAEIVDIDGIEGRGTMVGFAKDNVQLYR
ncbi:pilus assembly protein TadG-related protein [Mesorhizobium sp. M0496]|uniref:TadE/TadG family type IV pilus assembly protein n=1 Tax=Mesorhizobium sp. M0496 TaxID=2956952 RepID=UPI00333A0289